MDKMTSDKTEGKLQQLQFLQAVLLTGLYYCSSRLK